MQNCFYISISEPALLKIFIMSFRIRSAFCLDVFLKSTSPSSLCKPLDCFSSLFDNKDTSTSNTSSNHPPQIIKQLPISISNRLSNNSSNKQVFDMSKGEYEKALRESGHKNVSLIYQKDIKQKRNCSRNIIWFNPPFNKNVSLNVAKRFLSLLDQHFPKSNKLHAIFNRNTIKVSYSCTQNMSSMIKSHTKKVINKDVKESKSCNCLVKSECPLNG